MNEAVIWPVHAQKSATEDVNTTVTILPAVDTFVPAIADTSSQMKTLKSVRTSTNA